MRTRQSDAAPPDFQPAMPEHPHDRVAVESEWANEKAATPLGLLPFTPGHDLLVTRAQGLKRAGRVYRRPRAVKFAKAQPQLLRERCSHSCQLIDSLGKTNPFLSEVKRAIRDSNNVRMLLVSRYCRRP